MKCNQPNMNMRHFFGGGVKKAPDGIAPRTDGILLRTDGIALRTDGIKKATGERFLLHRGWN